MNSRSVIQLAVSAVIVTTMLLALGKLQIERWQAQPAKLSSVFEQRATRPTEARISALHVYRPYDESSPSRTFPPASIRIREIIERADQKGASRASILEASTLESIWGDRAAGAARLAHAIGRDPAHYDSWLDLSAVLLDRAATEADVAGQLLAASMNAALHAIRLVDADSRAWFNLALALQRFGITEAAATALRNSVDRERDGKWRSEYTRRLADLGQRNHRQRWKADRETLLDARVEISAERLSELVKERHQPVRELLEDELLPVWADHFLRGDPGAELLLSRAAALAGTLQALGGDAISARTIEQIVAAPDRRVIALAYRAYGSARRLYEESDREAALTQIDLAIVRFDNVRSAFSERARITRAMTLYQLGRYQDAERLALLIEQRSVTTNSPTVQGAAAWLLGIALTQRGAADEALLAYDRAATLLKQLGEFEDLAAVENSSANLLRITGDVSNGWRHVLNAARGMDYVYTSRRRHTIMLNASLFAAQHDQLLVALEFEEWSLRAAQERGVANTIVDAFMRRARLRLRVGDVASASADLALAVQAADKISSQSARAYLDSWLALVSGESVMQKSPADALAAFALAKELFEAAEPAELPNVYLAAARAQLQLGDLDRVEAELRRGIEVVSSRRDQIRAVTLQASYQDVSWELFDRLIDLNVDRGASAEAFRLSETSRNLLLTNRTGQGAVAAPEQVARSLAQGVVLVYYVATTDRLLIWTMSDGAVSFTTAPIGRQQLEVLVNRYRAALVSHASELDSLARSLNQSLLAGPLRGSREGSLVVVIPDGALHRLPFASLRGENGRYLIEDYPVAMVPSANAFLRSNHETASAGARGPIVLVGSSVVPTMPPLPEVAGEIREIAGLYPDARQLIGPQATFGNTLQAMKGSSILHFAGHAKANANIPWQSRLFFVPDQFVQNGMVTAEMLRSVDLASLQLVVFSACETGDGPILRGTGVSSLASTLLSRGVPSVVASLWAVDDKAMRKLLTNFHAAYIAGTPATSALRAAQVAMLRSKELQFSRPQSWSGVAIASAR